MERHGAISSFMRGGRFIKTLCFCISFKYLNDSICVLWIIFGSQSFNAEKIKNGHIGFNRANSLAVGISNINKVIEYELRII